MFKFGGNVWGYQNRLYRSNYYASKLQKLQNRAARILTSPSYDADALYFLQQLGWKDLITQG